MTRLSALYIAVAVIALAAVGVCAAGAAIPRSPTGDLWYNMRREGK